MENDKQKKSKKWIWIMLFGIVVIGLFFIFGGNKMISGQSLTSQESYLNPISSNVQQNGTINGLVYNYSFTGKNYMAYLNSNSKATKAITICKNGNNYCFTMDLSTSQLHWYNSTLNAIIGMQQEMNPQNTIANATDSSIYFSNAWINTDLQYLFDDSGVKENLIIRNVSARSSGILADYLQYASNNYYNNTLQVCHDGICQTHPSNWKFTTSSKIIYKDSNNNQVFNNPAPSISYYDNASNQTQTIQLAYNVTANNGIIAINIMVPTNVIWNQTSNEFRSDLAPFTLDPSFGDANCDSISASTCYLNHTYTASANEIISSNDANWTNLVLQNKGSISAGQAVNYVLNITGAITLNSGATIVGGNVTITASNLTINSGGSINTDSLGYQGGNSSHIAGYGAGGGGGGGSNQGGGGGSYGGGGGKGYPAQSVAGGILYGSSLNPNDMGSGGGSQNYYLTRNGGNGGGLLSISISNTLNNSGTISSNGATGVYGAGGSGGGIYINTNSFIGNGNLTANGGNGGYPGGGVASGGGGGGRIAVYYNSSSWTGIGNSFVNNGIGTAGGGASSGTNGTMILVNNTGTDVYIKSGFSTVTADKNTTFYNTNNPATFNFTNNNVTLDNINQQVPLSENIIFNIINQIGVFSMTGYGYNISVNISAVNLTIPTSSSINLNGNGYQGGLTGHVNGYGTGGGTGSASGNFAGAGGGHGGVGGNGYGGKTGGITYDSNVTPSDYGSGGGRESYYTGASGNSGGGAVYIVTSDTLTINGSITVNGGAVSAGGGAGGSIWINVTNLAGVGSLSASGSNGANNGGAGSGGGGGGRISISYQTNSTFNPSSVSVAGGTKGVNNGGAQDGAVGTIVSSLVLPANTCIYNGVGTWLIKFSDYCNITVTNDINGNNVNVSNISGAGTLNITSTGTITNFTRFDFDTGGNNLIDLWGKLG